MRLPLKKVECIELIEQLKRHICLSEGDGDETITVPLATAKIILDLLNCVRLGPGEPTTTRLKVAQELRLSKGRREVEKLAKSISLPEARKKIAKKIKRDSPLPFERRGISTIIRDLESASSRAKRRPKSRN